MRTVFLFWLAAQLALAIAAVLVVGPSRGRRVAAALFVLAGAALPWFSPPQPFARTLLALLTVVVLIKTTQIARAPGAWPARRRVWHLFVLFDVRHARGVAPALDRRLLGHVLIAGAVAAAAFLTLARLGAHTTPPLEILRLGCGVTLLYALMELSSTTMQFGHRIVGIDVPPLQHAPILARSAGEFWSVRWNRCVSDWLAQFAFRPFARRRRPALGLFAAFLASAALHAWLAGAALGGRAAVLMTAYFLVAAIVVIAEPYLGVRRWPSPVARAWTIFVLVAPSPLVIDPFLRVLSL